jgi:hypothetical protein
VKKSHAGHGKESGVAEKQDELKRILKHPAPFSFSTSATSRIQ